MSAGTWPEQEVIDAWLKKHGIAVAHADSMELKQAVTRIRISVATQLAQSEERVAKLLVALQDLLFVYENADETGYVTDVGFVKGFDQIPERCRALLSSSKTN